MSGIRSCLLTSLVLCISAAAAISQAEHLAYFEEADSRNGDILWDAKSGVVYAFFDVPDGDNWEVKVLVFDGDDFEIVSIVGGVNSNSFKGNWYVARQDRTGTMLIVYYKEDALIGQQIGKDGRPRGKPRKIISFRGGNFMALGSYGRNEFLVAYNRVEDTGDGEVEGIFMQRLTKKGKPKGGEVFLNNFSREGVRQAPTAIRYGTDGPILYLVEGYTQGQTRENIIRVLALNDALGDPKELYTASETVDSIYGFNPHFFVRYNPSVGRHIISWDFNYFDERNSLVVFDNDGNFIRPLQELPPGNQPESAFFNEDDDLITTLFVWPNRPSASYFGLMNFTPRGQIVSTGINIPGISISFEHVVFSYVRIAPLPKGGLLLLVSARDTETGEYGIEIVEIKSFQGEQ